MDGLFKEDYSQKRDSLTTKIQTHIASFYRGAPNRKFKLQAVLNNYKALDCYQNIRSKQPALVSAINDLQKHIPFLDLNETDFRNSFPFRSNTAILELVMANFFSERFELLKHLAKKGNQESTSDLTFLNQETAITYYVECTTRDSSKMNKYCENLPNPNKYLEMAKIFFQKLQSLQANSESWSSYKWYWEPIVDQLWSQHLNEEEKKALQDASQGISIEDFQEWIYLSRYALFHFEDILPRDLAPYLENLGFDRTLSEGASIQIRFYEYLLESIVIKIIEKLEKKYFEDNTPVILVISLATMTGSLGIGISTFFNHIENNLQRKLNEAISKLSFDRCQELARNLKNLYAIVIDTSFYNWFPEIFGGSMPASGNCYAVIYNTNSSFDFSQHGYILNLFIENRMQLSLEIDSPIVEETV